MHRFGDRYRVVRDLGRGSATQLFEAVIDGDEGFERRVFIKWFSGPKEDEARFVDAGRFAGRLNHQNLVPALDLGSCEDRPFIVLEFVDGANLSTLIARRTAPVAAALHVVAQVARGLHHAHSQGVVHRDVSLANIMLDEAGHARLTDFDISSNVAQPAKTAVGVVLGKVEYMSPEHARGDAVSARADIFALGCVLHAMLTGASPLAGRSIDEVAGLHDVPMADDLPPDVATVLGRALQINPQRRFESALEFARNAEVLISVDEGWRAAVAWAASKPAARSPLAVPDLGLSESPVAPARQRTTPIAPDPRDRSATVESFEPSPTVTAFGGETAVLPRRSTAIRTPVSGGDGYAAWIGGLGIVAVLCAGALAYTFATSSSPPSPPQPTNPDVDRPVVRPVTETPRAIAPIDPTPVERKSIRAPRRQRAPDGTKAITRALRSRGLSLADVEGTSAYRSWRRARGTAGEHSERDVLVAEIAAFEMTTALATKKLRRVGAKLEAVVRQRGREAVRAAEEDYFDLQERLSRRPTAAEIELIIRGATRLEADLNP